MVGHLRRVRTKELFYSCRPWLINQPPLHQRKTLINSFPSNQLRKPIQTTQNDAEKSSCQLRMTSSSKSVSARGPGREAQCFPDHKTFTAHTEVATARPLQETILSAPAVCRVERRESAREERCQVRRARPNGGDRGRPRGSSWNPPSGCFPELFSGPFSLFLCWSEHSGRVVRAQGLEPGSQANPVSAV